MARPRNTEIRRRQIVDGLRHVMADRGYEGASIHAIARAAGLTPGLVHYHFGSKQEILIGLVQLLADHVRARYEVRSGQVTSARERVEAFIDSHVALDADADPNAVRCWVMVGAEALHQGEVHQVYQEAVRVELELFEKLIRDTLVDSGKSTSHARAMSAAVFSAIQGAYQLSVSTDLLPRGFASTSIKAMTRGLLHSTKESS